MEINLSYFSIKKLQLLNDKLSESIIIIQNQKKKKRHDYRKLTRLSILRGKVIIYLFNRLNGKIDLVDNIVIYE